MAAVSADPRVEAYAKLLCERCLRVQPGMQVVIRTTPLARPAVLALERELARRGAYPILRIGFDLWPSKVFSGASMVTRASMWSEANVSISDISPRSSVGASRAQGGFDGHRSKPMRRIG